MASKAINLLIVDDKPENLVALEELLTDPDRVIMRAESGNQALRLLLQHDFAVVLLDVQMPGMDGFETATLMRGTEATRSVPIIFLTAGDRTEERAFRGYEVGAVDFLYKPVNPLLLRSKVNVFVELHRRHHDLVRLNGALERTGTALQAKVADLENVNRTLSHDLRAPLRSIRGFTEILAETLGERLDAEGQRCVRRILAAGERMGRMLDDLYSLLKLSATDDSFPLTDCGAVLRDTLEDVRRDLDESGAEVTHDPLPSVRANPMLLGQILQNLITNAIKFRGDRALSIRVTAQREEGAWRIGVSDNGIGIPSESHARVFDLFNRLASENMPGTGVGLALVKRAVEKHGGRIWIDSRVNEGSSFYFTIPDRG
jgi:two-component system sensor histidine kinase/response regulator